MSKAAPTKGDKIGNIGLLRGTDYDLLVVSQIMEQARDKKDDG